MPLNKDFTHRLQALDACLRRSMRQWDADALLEEVNRKLEDKWGAKISRRTLFSDLKYLQEDQGAPVEKYKEGSRVFYRYTQPDYSIQKLPLAGEDVGFLKEAVQMLRQISSFSVLDEVEAIVIKLQE